MEFKVIEVTKQGIVIVEPIKGKFTLEDEIPPGCIQHIISSLLTHGNESKEICDNMCRILSRVNMDDYSSCKITPATLLETPLSTPSQLTTKILLEDITALKSYLSCLGFTKAHKLQRL